MNFEETEALRKMNQEYNKAYKIALAKARKAPNTELQSAFSEEIGAAMPNDFSTRARLHYAKALRKHPRFANALFANGDHNERVREDADYLRELECDLEETREDIYLSTRGGTLEARYLLSCEVEEAHVAHLKGDAAACVEELYDAVAVLMRMIAAVEGKQKLGGKAND